MSPDGLSVAPFHNAGLVIAEDAQATYGEVFPAKSFVLKEKPMPSLFATITHYLSATTSAQRTLDVKVRYLEATQGSTGLPASSVFTGSMAHLAENEPDDLEQIVANAFAARPSRGRPANGYCQVEQFLTHPPAFRCHSRSV